MGRELSQEERARATVRITMETVLDNEVVDSIVREGTHAYACVGSRVQDGSMELMHEINCSESLKLGIVDFLLSDKKLAGHYAMYKFSDMVNDTGGCNNGFHTCNVYNTI